MGCLQGAAAIWSWWRPRPSPKQLHSGRGGAQWSSEAAWWPSTGWPKPDDRPATKLSALWVAGRREGPQCATQSNRVLVVVPARLLSVGVGGRQSVCMAHRREQQAKGMLTFRLHNEANPLKGSAKKLVE